MSTIVMILGYVCISLDVGAVYRYNTSLLPVVSRDPFLLAVLTSGLMNSTLLLTFSTIIQINLTHIRMI